MTLGLFGYKCHLNCWAKEHKWVVGQNRNWVEPNGTLGGGLNGNWVAGPNRNWVVGPNGTWVGGLNGTWVCGPNSTWAVRPNCTRVVRPNSTFVGRPNGTWVGGLSGTQGTPHELMEVRDMIPSRVLSSQDMKSPMMLIHHVPFTHPEHF